MPLGGQVVAVAVAAKAVLVRVAVAGTTVPVGQPPTAGRKTYRVGTSGCAKRRSFAAFPPRAEAPLGGGPSASGAVLTITLAPAGRAVMAAWEAKLPVNGSGTPATSGWAFCTTSLLLWKSCSEMRSEERRVGNGVGSG